MQKYKGKCIGVITPSRHTEGFLKSIKKTIRWIESYGIKVKLGKCFNKKYHNSSATKEERVSEIHEMFLDKEVDFIMCSLGGDSTNQILDQIDYKLIKNNPKPLVGSSDITNLILSIFSWLLHNQWLVLKIFRQKSSVQFDIEICKTTVI